MGLGLKYPNETIRIIENDSKLDVAKELASQQEEEFNTIQLKAASGENKTILPLE